MTAGAGYTQPSRFSAQRNHLHGQRIIIGTVHGSGTRSFEYFGCFQFVQNLQRASAAVPKFNRTILMSRYDDFKVATRCR